jgi:dienelactone hydrolase
MQRLILAGTAILAFSLGLAADVQKKDVDIKGPDGMNLKGSYFSPGRPGPAMLLLHQCNMDRHAWDGLAKDLADAGFHVLTLDFRGFGESGGGATVDAAERRKVIQEKWPGDVDAAYEYLKGQKGVDPARIAAGGASCGVTQASDLAARHREIKALMLLSGSASGAAKAYLAATPSLPVFGAASEGDTNAAKGIKEAAGESKNSRTTVKIYAGTEHGVPMFAKNAELEPMIVSWLKAQLAGHGGAH